MFVGTVVEQSSELIGGNLSWTVYRVAVTQPLRGTAESFVTVVPGQRPTAENIEASKSHPQGLWVSTSCDYNFTVGRTYIIYAREISNGRWSTSQCTGTKPIEQASDDLAYFARIRGAEPSGSVYGRVERTVADPADATRPRVIPAPDVSIALMSGANRVSVTSDSDGKIDAPVPPGEYTVTPMLPPTVRANGGPRRIIVPARGCAPIAFSLIANGRIEGRVLRAEGTSVARAAVDVIPVNFPDDQLLDNPTIAPSATTDAEGRFDVELVLPGRYRIAVNARTGARLESPYETTYAPGVDGKTAALVIDLGEGERRTDVTIVVTPLVETTISGIVEFDDGQPVSGLP